MRQSEVRDVAIHLWNTLNFGTGSEQGLSISRHALAAAFRAAEGISALPDSRMDHTGLPLDYHAPTVWHAICTLLYAFIFDLFGRIDQFTDAKGLAQHYELPTTFVDFTFDPRVAIWFACGCSKSQEPACSPEAANDHAVVYFTSFLKLLNTSTLQLRF